MKPLSRRTVLRGVLGGAAVSVGLPLLEAMLDVNGEALATGEALPTRFGLWFWGNGVRPDQWVPASTGPGFAPSAEVAPLAGVLPYVSLVSGCTIKTATHPHHSGMAGIFTGKRYYEIGAVRDTIATTFDGPSVDQLAADHFAGQTPFRSLEVGVTRFRGTDEGSTFQHLSHNGPNQPNPAEYDPIALYNRLFGTPVDGQRDLARMSVLDGVTDRIAQLRPRLSASDSQRVDQHLASVRTLELRLAADAGVCSVIDEPTASPDIDGREQIAEKNQTMSELVALALACDLTRVFSVLWSTAGSGVVVWQAGADESLHVTCHEEALPQPIVHGATVFTMENLATFLATLRDTPEGAGNLLDNCSILACSELTDGWTHSNEDFPLLVAGRGGGRLVGGVHHRAPLWDNATRATLTALRGAGVPAASFGAAEGYVTESFSELEA
ncbi:MAG: hypothetical protein ACI8PZ_002748 [Myxococcota bacterium]|jgi:hypothetical protein